MKILTKRKEKKIAKILADILYLMEHKAKLKTIEDIETFSKIIENLAEVSFEIGGDEFAWRVQWIAEGEPQ